MSLQTFSLSVNISMIYVSSLQACCITIMSKAMRTVFMCCYAFLLIQYLKISLTPVVQQIDIDYVYRSARTMNNKEMMQRKYHNLSMYIKMFTKPERFKTDLKFILKYTAAFLHYGTPLYKNGQTPFIESNCTYYNCYLTTEKKLLNDHRDFDAIMFDVENSWDGPMMLRDPYQKFIFVASESAANYPLCDAFYDSHYNLTWTYKLDSDIRWSYVSILDLSDNYVGPRINMTWIESEKPTPLNIKKKLVSKTKAAAWFVSNCNAISGRQNVTHLIEKELNKYNLTVDIYGWCGRLKCPKDRLDECLNLLETDYYFYFSFENSICEDYVTEKILYPLQNYAVPVVFGGADYTRFLPPGSYINARDLNAKEVAEEMYKAIQNPNIYENYFRWHNHYKYVKNPPNSDICRLCQILNEDADKYSTYKNFRYWWNPQFSELCAKGIGRLLVMKPEFDGVLEVNHRNEKQDTQRPVRKDFLF